MKRPVAAALTALAVAALVAPTVPAAAVDAVDSSKLREAVTVNGILQHERALYAIAAKNDGTRASGTQGYDDSVKYVTKKLKKAGFKVKTQTFTFPFFRELAPATLAVTAPTAADLEIATFDYSGSGDVTGTARARPAASSCRRRPEPSSARPDVRRPTSPRRPPSRRGRPRAAGHLHLRGQGRQREGRRLRRGDHLQRGSARPGRAC